MGLTAEKKRLIIRRVIFAVLLIFCAVIQNTPGLLPEPFGAHQLAVTVMVVCIAMFERETAGMLLGLLAEAFFKHLENLVDALFRVALLAQKGAELLKRVFRVVEPVHQLVRQQLLGSGGTGAHDGAAAGRGFHPLR